MVYGPLQVQINPYLCNCSKETRNTAWSGPQTKDLYFLITRYIKGYRDTGILKTSLSCELSNFSLIYKTEILHILESNPKINQSSLPQLYPIMEINVYMFSSKLSQNIVGSQTPFIKNRWQLKWDMLTFICVFSVQCTLHLFKKHYKTPNRGTIYN